MEIGLFSHTHGIPTREDADFRLQQVPVEEMRVLEIAQLADRLGYHTIWSGDHIVMDRDTSPRHVAANASGKRSYPDRPITMEPITFLASVAAATERLRVATGILVAPYRHPLSVAHQMATIDQLSRGRVTVGVGPGWLEGEFEALGLDVRARARMTRECIEVYKQAWTDPWLDFHGEFFSFVDVSMEPKPYQDPHPPLIYGGISERGVHRAVELCDGLFPTFLDRQSEPGLHDGLREELVRYADEVGRDLTNFHLVALTVAQVGEGRASLPEFDQELMLTGSPDEILEDLAALAERGYTHCATYLDVRSGTVGELIEQIQAFGELVLPEAAKLKPAPLA